MNRKPLVIENPLTPALSPKGAREKILRLEVQGWVRLFPAVTIFVLEAGLGQMDRNLKDCGYNSRNDSLAFGG